MKKSYAALLLSVLAASPALADAPLDTYRREVSRDDQFVPLRPVTVASLRSAFMAWFEGNGGALEALGFEMKEVQPGVIGLARQSGVAKGQGGYLWRPSGLPVLIQAPHQFKDEMTGDILTALMAEGNFSAASFNTHPRWRKIGGRMVESDLAHWEGTTFEAHARAFAEAFPKGRIVQLHGYAKEKRKTAAGRAADIIVSNGTSRPSEAAKTIAACLKTSGFGRIGLYGEDVSELGATTNTNAKALRSDGFANFVHVEMSRPVRDRLKKSVEARSAFTLCLTKGVG